jgi:hypothetical protein
VSGRLYAQAALPPGKQRLLFAEYEVECDPRAGLDSSSVCKALHGDRSYTY